MSVKAIYHFPSELKPTLAEVGGKGLSLVEASSSHLPVPPGFILPVSFFTPWMDKLQSTTAWKTFLKAEEKNLSKACDELKQTTKEFSFTKEQKELLFKELDMYDKEALFAVRSSSPEEDLAGASFAGGYETILGVKAKNIENAVKKAFASCLDYRVVIYKKENGFNYHDPKIAVIVQEQIASEISGVGFSLNPITNNYDEAVINSNWGLGETIVSGVVTPDTFSINKITKKITEKLIGKKEFTLLLNSAGDIEKKLNYKSKEMSLTDEQIIALSNLITTVEDFYQKQIDIEWAFAKEKLYLLQARPITSFVPLYPDMITDPGEKKRLYFDVTVTAQAMNMPVSKMGTSMFHQLVKIIGRIIALRDVTKNIDTTVGWISEGKIYINLSNAMVMVGKKHVVDALTIIDPLGAEAVGQLDEREYKSKTAKHVLLPYGLIARIPGILLFVHRAINNPDKMHNKVQNDLRKFEDEVRTIVKKDLPIPVLFDELVNKMFMQVFKKTVPLTVASRFMFEKLKRIAGNDPDINLLERSLSHNMTVEMGLALSHVAKLLPNDLDEKKFEKKLQEKTLPESFLNEWERFLFKYGYRGPAEIDIAAKRYKDDPKLLFSLLFNARNASGEDAQERFERGEKERNIAYKNIYEKIKIKNPGATKQFAKNYHFFETFGGYRETHKYYLVLIVGLMQEKVLAQAKEFVAENRLETIEQVFDLTIEQFENAKKDKSLNLRSLASSNTVFLKKLAKVQNPPSLIDSRGFIPRPPKRKAKEGEIAGLPMSNGVIKARVKVLHTAHEKPLKKGEILVARATDPGWTPLFVNASGLIMEVGGVLQHGALVAREYGLPCVSGVEKATEIFKDGMLVELNGTTGIIRIIEK